MPGTLALLLAMTRVASPGPVATASTSTPAALAPEPPPPPSLLDDLPLSDEDIALLEQLEAPLPAVPTSTRSDFLEIYQTTHVTGRDWDASIARSVGEALRSQSVLVETSRRYAGEDSLFVRGRSGHRVSLTLDGVDLHHALSSARRSGALRDVDVSDVEHADIITGAATLESAHGGFGGVHLSTHRAPTDPGLRTEAHAMGRIADRSLGFRAAAEAGGESVGLRVMGGYSDLQPSRDGNGNAIDATDYAEASVSVRGRVMGGSEDGFGIEVGFDHHRLSDLPRPDLDAAVDRLATRTAAWGRFQVGDDEAGLSFLSAYSRLDSELDQGGQIDDVSVGTLQLEATANYRPVEPLSLFLGTDLRLSGSSDQLDRVNGQTLRFSGMAGAAVQRPHLIARLILRTGWSSSELESGATPSTSGTLFFADTEIAVPIVRAFALYVGGAQSMHPPSVLDLFDAGGSSLAPETVRTIESGARISLESFMADLGFFYSWTDDALELRGGVLENVDLVTLFGGQAEATWSIGEHLELSGAASLTRNADEVPAGIEGVSMIGKVRYDIGARDAYVEASIRFARPFDDPAGPQARATWRGPVVELGGGTQLGAGFELGLRVTNTLDQSNRELIGDLPRPGVDLRSVLTHRGDWL